MTFEFTEPSLELFRAARFSYMIGKPIMLDSEYDVLERIMKQKFPDAEEINQLYENDKINSDELIRFGIDPLLIDMYSRSREYKVESRYRETSALTDERNSSIISMKTDEEVYTKFMQLGQGKYRLSPKIDGLFVFLVYERVEEGSNEFRLVTSMSRGDSNSRIDLTNSMSGIVATRLSLDVKQNAIRFNGEAIYDRDYLDLTGYVTQRTACQGVLSSTVNVKSEQFKYIKYFVHGGITGESYMETLKKADDAGLRALPTFEFEFKQSYSQEDMLFSMQPVVNLIRLWSDEEKINIDGIVAVKVDDEQDEEVLSAANKQYKSNVFAIKTGFWNKGFYQSEIVGILTDQQDDRVSFKLDIVPVTASNGSKLTKVTDINLSTLIRDDIRVGDVVAFKYMNETTIKYLYKVVEQGD